MKVKRFNNLWAMGLILFGAILVALYLIKIFFPKFIIGIAEIPEIVRFGMYVDSHKWAYYIFYTTISFFTLYLYACGCCRCAKLNLRESIIILFLVIISHLIERFLPIQSFVYNNILYLLIPFIICLLRKNNDYKVFYSTAIFFIITSLAQSLSLEIRGISTMINYPNSATFFILVIDGTIWHILLYLYFNYKGGKTNG